MTTLVGSVAAWTVLLVLLIAVAGHLASPTTLPRAVAAHGVLPRPMTVAAAVTLAEVSLVAAGAVAVSSHSAGWLRFPAFAGSAALFAAYAGYTQHVRAIRPGTPCGCSRGELPVTGWVVARAYLLAGLALLAAVLSGSVLTVDRPGDPLVVVLLAATAFGALLWHLPAAMHLPTRAPHDADTRQLREGAA